ncbi:hypothetical protein BMS3Abin16_00644 [archaeon BMS3Abin16]|nr:hypothetical protein BMS3Abin16_00644 [archaeon BMS3Abin16]
MKYLVLKRSVEIAGIGCVNAGSLPYHAIQIHRHLFEDALVCIFLNYNEQLLRPAHCKDRDKNFAAAKNRVIDLLDHLILRLPSRLLNVLCPAVGALHNQRLQTGEMRVCSVEEPGLFIFEITGISEVV